MIQVILFINNHNHFLHIESITVTGNIRPQKFKHWIALSSGSIAIQWISNYREANDIIHMVEISPVNSVIHVLNNWRQSFTLYPYQIIDSRRKFFFLRMGIKGL